MITALWNKRSQLERGLMSKILFFTLVVIFLQGIVIIHSQPAGQKIEDSDITYAVETELLIEDSVPASRLDVKTQEGIVSLSGHVNNILAKEEAVKIARSIKGVRSVVDKIMVSPGDKTDEELSKDVENALMRDPATEGYEINVESTDGIVVLSGTVESWQEKELSETVAKGVPGVVDVKNNIKIKYKSERADREIKTEIKKRLRSDVLIDGEMINVEVKDGNVVLTGSVGSAIEREQAIEDAWVAGVESVVADKLKVAWWERDQMQREPKQLQITDQQIEKAVKEAFKYDPRLSPYTPKVEVKDGVVTLSGIVGNLMAKKAAEKDAQNTVGVWRVKNFIKVRPQAHPSDQKITQNVREMIDQDVYLEEEKGFEVVVHTRNGKVFLSGLVDSPFQKARIEELASKVNGVVAIQNNIKVRELAAWKRDWEIKQDIQDQLYWNPRIDEEDISVRVNNGVAILSGTVDTWRERVMAPIEAVKGGAIKVQNNIRVRKGPEYYKPEKK